MTSWNASSITVLFAWNPPVNCGLHTQRNSNSELNPLLNKQSLLLWSRTLWRSWDVCVVNHILEVIWERRNTSANLFVICQHIEVQYIHDKHKLLFTVDVSVCVPSYDMVLQSFGEVLFLLWIFLWSTCWCIYTHFLPLKIALDKCQIHIRTLLTSFSHWIRMILFTRAILSATSLACEFPLPTMQTLCHIFTEHNQMD